jgi:hypothetical protein
MKNRVRAPPTKNRNLLIPKIPGLMHVFGAVPTWPFSPPNPAVQTTIPVAGLGQAAV